MKQRLKNLLRAALLGPLGMPLAALYGGRAACLMYHHIAPGAMQRSSRFAPNLVLYVAEEEFEKQIRYLAHHYECLSMGEAVARLSAGTLHRGTAIVTFDDGYRDNLLAVPILKHYGVPATIYITTGAIDRERSFWWDEHEVILTRLDRLAFTWRDRAFQWDLSNDVLKLRAFHELNRFFKSLTPVEQDEVLVLMHAAAREAGGEPPFFDAETMLSWDDIIALDREPLITIGAHTIDHFVSSQLTPEELTRQAGGSRDALERRLGHPVEHFAFPFGREEHAGPREFSIVAAAGFQSAVTTRPLHWRAGSRVAMHALPRIAIDYGDTLQDFRWKITGLANAIHRPMTLFANQNPMLAV
ncbi:MAG: polysaccharide deacetylase family protein [Acidobacteriota bacterium]|nr:polysaccharide deacetylase family protein [Acidobacteriota bacterium]